MDQRDGLEIEKLRMEIKPASLQETISKAMNEAREIEHSLETVAIEKEESSIASNADDDISKSLESEPEPWKKILDTEKWFVDNLLAVRQFRFNIIQNPKLKNREIGDILVRSNLPEDQDKIIEIKLFQTRITLDQILDSVTKLKLIANVYKSDLNRLPSMQLFLVYEPGIATMEEIKDLKETLKKHPRLKNPHLHIHVYSTTQLKQINFSSLLS